ncbi:hypothetical protein BTH95_09230, partial [Lactobacillus delbrueckii subsp. bulgaricus]|nr:hypothetical protein [Lactobacillus delbrueckii subsp. bulgaricus]
QGFPGPKGVDGRTPYFHVAYANSADGKDGFYVGGETNLALGTSSEDQSAGDANQTTGWIVPTIATFDNPQAGKQYTISFNAKSFNAKHNGRNWFIEIWDGTGPYERRNWIKSFGPISTQGQKNTYTFTWPDGKNKYLIVQLSNNNEGGQIIWNSAMLEEGKVAHSWSPAPEEAHPIYIGTYTDYTQADSLDPTAYLWTKIKGEKGDTGQTGA